jgi:hypothetical protein
MMAHVDLWLAIGVVLSTAATDAVYVMFNAAVSSQRRVPAATWRQRLVFVVGVCSDQLYEELGLCLFCGGGVVDWCLFVDDLVEEGKRG